MENTAEVCQYLNSIIPDDNTDVKNHIIKEIKDAIECKMIKLRPCTIMDYPNYGKSLDLRLILIIPYRRERNKVNCAMLVSLDRFEECEPYLFLNHLHDKNANPLFKSVVLNENECLYLSDVLPNYYWQQKNSLVRVLSESITYIQKGIVNQNPHPTRKNYYEQEFTFDQIEQYHIPYDQLVIDWNHCIGKGTYAEVYTGWYTGYEVVVKVWLKQLDQIEERYFIREVLAGCTMNHPNCIRYFGHSETTEGKDERGNIYPSRKIIVMEKGKESLRDYLLKNREDMNNRLIMINQIANGLYHIHSQGFIHRDMKLDNLLIGKDGYVKICDYGFNRNNPELSQQLSCVGSYSYIAPELCGSGHNANNTVDVYSFGCIILEILTNQYVHFNHSGITKDNVMQYVAEGNRPFIPDYLPEKCKYVIRECFKDHDYRPSIDVIREMVVSWTVDDISELDFSTRFAEQNYYSMY